MASLWPASAALVFSPGALLPGTAYSFLLSATDGAGTGSAEVSFTTAPAPRGQAGSTVGALTVSVAATDAASGAAVRRLALPATSRTAAVSALQPQGVAFSTPFALRASWWAAADGPLLYQFQYCLSEDGARPVVLSGFHPEPALAGVTLPPGPLSRNGDVTLQLCVPGGSQRDNTDMYAKHCACHCLSQSHLRAVSRSRRLVMNRFGEVSGPVNATVSVSLPPFGDDALDPAAATVAVLGKALGSANQVRFFERETWLVLPSFLTTSHHSPHRTATPLHSLLAYPFFSRQTTQALGFGDIDSALALAVGAAETLNALGAANGDEAAPRSTLREAVLNVVSTCIAAASASLGGDPGPTAVEFWASAAAAVVGKRSPSLELSASGQEAALDLLLRVAGAGHALSPAAAQAAADAVTEIVLEASGGGATGSSRRVLQGGDTAADPRLAKAVGVLSELARSLGAGMAAAGQPAVAVGTPVVQARAPSPAIASGRVTHCSKIETTESSRLTFSVCVFSVHTGGCPKGRLPPLRTRRGGVVHRTSVLPERTGRFHHHIRGHPV